jgi:hypothetical protein
MYHNLDYEKIVPEVRNIISEYRSMPHDDEDKDLFALIERRVLLPKGIREEDMLNVMNILVELDTYINNAMKHSIIYMTLKNGGHKLIGHKGKNHGSFFIS